MLIARQKQQENIAEYVLYMWQLEDLIRSYNFDIQKIETNIINQYQQSSEVKQQIREWYESLILLMEQEGVKTMGHLKFIKNTLDELIRLHLTLLTSGEEERYEQLYAQAAPHIEQLKQHTDQLVQNDIELCFNGLYGLMLLRMKKKEISYETMEAMRSFSALLAFLSAKYKEWKN